jgi:hypothetical protein
MVGATTDPGATTTPVPTPATSTATTVATTIAICPLSLNLGSFKSLLEEAKLQ